MHNDNPLPLFDGVAPLRRVELNTMLSLDVCCSLDYISGEKDKVCEENKNQMFIFCRQGSPSEIVLALGNITELKR